MAATDYIGIVYDQLWTLLEASSAFTAIVPVGNRIKISKGKLQPYKTTGKQSQDTPEFVIDLGTTTDQGFTTTPTFGNVAGTCTARIKVFQQVYIMSVLADTLDIVKANAVRAEAVAAIEAGGLRLGQAAYVISWGPATGVYAADGQGQAAGTKRRQFRFNLPVNFRFAVQ